MRVLVCVDARSLEECLYKVRVEQMMPNVEKDLEFQPEWLFEVKLITVRFDCDYI